MVFEGNDINLEEADIKRSAPNIDYKKYIKDFFGKKYNKLERYRFY